jgi:hypothetical protein
MEEDHERFVINVGFANSDEDSEADNNAAEYEKSDSDMEDGDNTTDIVHEGAQNVQHFQDSGTSVTAPLVMM